MSATQSEAESMLRHWEKKVSLNNQAFIARQQEALWSVDEHIGAACLGLKDAAVIFAKDLEVKNFQSMSRFNTQ